MNAPKHGCVMLFLAVVGWGDSWLAMASKWRHFEGTLRVSVLGPINPSESSHDLDGAGCLSLMVLGLGLRL